MYFRIILLCSWHLFFYMETDGCYIAFKLASTWMCSQGCASTAWPFRLLPFSLAIISYSPIPFLRSQTACLPSRRLILSFFSPDTPLGPFLQSLVSPQLSLRRCRDFSLGAVPGERSLRLSRLSDPPPPPALPLMFRGFLAIRLPCCGKCTVGDSGKITSLSLCREKL